MRGVSRAPRDRVRGPRERLANPQSCCGRSDPAAARCPRCLSVLWCADHDRGDRLLAQGLHGLQSVHAADEDETVVPLANADRGLLPNLENRFGEGFHPGRLDALAALGRDVDFFDFDRHVFHRFDGALGFSVALHSGPDGGAVRSGKS